MHTSRKERSFFLLGGTLFLVIGSAFADEPGGRAVAAAGVAILVMFIALVIEAAQRED